MHGNCVLRLHAHAKRLPTPDVPLFWLACGHGTTAALRVIIAILLCKTGCVAVCPLSCRMWCQLWLGLPAAAPSPTSANLLAWQKHKNLTRKRGQACGAPPAQGWIWAAPC